MSPLPALWQLLPPWLGAVLDQWGWLPLCCLAGFALGWLFARYRRT